MKTVPPPRLLRQFHLHLILSRVVLPLLAVSLLSVVGVGFLGQRTLIHHQREIVGAVAQLVGLHLEHGRKSLDAIARLADTCESPRLASFMESTWTSDGDFETLYCLDDRQRIRLIMPPAHDYAGLDMSNLPDFKEVLDESRWRISSPFISIRTGEPTVYLVRALAGGGAVVGELNLGIFQKMLTGIADSTEGDFVFITNQQGRLLAHPDMNQVRQQVNVSNLGIFKRIEAGETHAYYPDQEQMMIGSGLREPVSGWRVIDQTPLSDFLWSYAGIFVLSLLATAVIWAVLAWSLRKQIEAFVVAPLEQLSRDVTALSRGPESADALLSASPVACVEVQRLISDFQAMSAALRSRERALRESEKLYRTLTEGHPDGIIRLDTGCRHLFVNEAAQRMAGLPVEWLIGRSMAELPAPADPARFRPLFESCRRVLETTQPDTVDFVWPSGRISEVRHLPEFDEQGRVSSVLGIAHDITEQKRVTAALLDSERHFRTLAENIPDYVVRYDTQARVIFMNAAATTALGGKSLTQASQAVCVAAGDRPGVQRSYAEVLEEVIRSGDSASIVTHYADEPFAGQVHNIRLVAERDEGGVIVGAIAIGCDITDVRNAERKVEESRNMLRLLIARNTSGREDERKSMAREIHDELGQILTALRLDIAMLEFQYGNENTALGKRCQHLIGLVDQTIQIVRDVAIALRPAVLDLGIASALEWLATDFQSRTGIPCRLHLDETLMDFDEHQSIAIFRIVQESLTNIIRHAAARQVDISFELDETTGTLSIRDDGIGFDPETVHERSLGLLGIQERALMIDGEARFVSAPGQGTTIQIVFRHRD